MMKRSLLLRSTACAMTAALVLTACRGGDDSSSSSAGGGITDEPCPDAVNADNGCIYLGVISDLTKGPFAPLAVPITDAQEAFWKKVNEEGGVGGYDINITDHIEDAEYNTEIHNKKYQEMRDDIAALGQTLGSPQTMAILADMETDNVVGVPASWNSAWEFEDLILEAGTSYCFAAMNGVDWAVENRGSSEKVVAVGYAGDYGGDNNVGVKAAAEHNGLEYVEIETPSGQENQAGAISQIQNENPDLVFISTGPAEMATIVGALAQSGFSGTVLGSSPTWNPALVDSPALPALQAMYFQVAPWGPWGSDTPGHQALRDALGADYTPNDGATAGWVWSYTLLATLEAAAELDGGITRENIVEAAGSLDEVDYQGMLPNEAGATDGEPDEVAFRESVVAAVDPSAPTGVSIVQDFTAGPTVTAYDFSEPCYSLS